MKRIVLIYVPIFFGVANKEDGNDFVFSTKLPEDIAMEINRHHIEPIVINNLVQIWNTTKEVSNCVPRVDKYLLDESKCTQNEREYIIDSIARYLDAVPY